MFNFFTKTALGMCVVFLTSSSINAQVSVNATDDGLIRKKDQAQHAEWKEGKNQFPGRPRDMWQIGIGGGSFIIGGDVKPQFGWGASLHVRKSIGYVFSLKAEYMFGQARGLNYQASTAGAHPNIFPFPLTPTGNPNIVVKPGLYTTGNAFYANYFVPQYHSLSLQTVYNLNNIKFHRKNNKWSLNLIVGLGANLYQTKINALNSNDAAYNSGTTNMSTVSAGLDATNIADRKTLRDRVKAILDDSYETLAQQNSKNIFHVGKDEKRMVVNPYVSLGLSLEFLITSRISIALEHQAFISDDDYIDGKSRKENGANTSNIDIPHYTSLRLNFHIGKKSKRIQPLWFVNPLVYPMQDVADLKEKLDDDWFKDSDDDGVPDALDQEPDTPPDTEVDSKGRTLDSDGDGVPNSSDKEPFSPPGYPTDEDGIANVPKPITADDVEVIEGENGPKLVIGEETYEPLAGKGGGGILKDWYLPMIHFDLDKYYLRPEAYEQLLHVASVMKGYPDLKVVAHGHTDIRASDEYNDMLSYNRSMTAIDYLVNKHGIDRSRFIVKYNGEGKNLVENARKEPEHFMNRRVEFYITEGDEKGQDKPTSDGGANRKWKY